MNEGQSIKTYRADVEFRHYGFEDAVQQLRNDGYDVKSLTEVEHDA